jgi:Uma2 family endonuclease
MKPMKEGDVATIDDLYRVEGQVELIDGTIVQFPPHGHLPGMIKGNISFALHHFAALHQVGEAFMSTLGYVVPRLPSGRESFCPDASYHTGPLPQNLVHFVEGAPTFAVEVRNLGDYGSSAESEMVAKRLDYFLAGTLAVWDVDPIAETVTLYKHTAPTQPIVFGRGSIADAEPAVPGWRMPVDDVFA